MEADNMITKGMLLEIGRKKGLVNKEYIEKDYFQDLFLFNLFKRTNKFIFKGGTALYKLYGLPRFSEDLDFSLLEDLNFDLKEVIESSIKNVNLFNIKSTKKTSDSFLIKIGCTGILTKYNSLRIDVNLKNQVINGFDVKNYVPEYIDISPFSLRTLKLEEVISEKTHSIFSREKARDLFDLFFLLRMCKFNKKLVERKLRIFDMTYSKKVLKEKINNIENVWEKELSAFVLTELPEFENVKTYILSKVN